MDAQALGRFLRQTRESRELTLDEAERALKIRRAVLESFELGEFTLPNAPAVQIRGFIRNYASYLGLDEERVLQQYDEALLSERGARGSSAFGVMRKRAPRRDAAPAADSSARLPLPAPTPPPPSAGPASHAQAPRTSTLTLLLRLVVALAAVAVIAFVVLQLLPLGELTNADLNATQVASDILAALPPTVPPDLQPTPTLLVIATEVATVPASAYTGQGLLLEIDMTQRAWMRISADGIEQFVGLARPGQRFEIRAVDNITLLSSNAEALDALFNGQPQPLYGGRGQRVDITYRADGVQIVTGPGFAPTPIVSSTPLPTPTDSAGTLTALLTPSDTPGPSPTPSSTFTASSTPTQTLTPSSTFTPSSTPTITLTPSATFTASSTPSATPVPSDTPIPTSTFTPSATPTPSPTVPLPPRVTPFGATPGKTGG